jgi:hypothetical protein
MSQRARELVDGLAQVEAALTWVGVDRRRLAREAAVCTRQARRGRRYRDVKRARLRAALLAVDTTDPAAVIRATAAAQRARLWDGFLDDADVCVGETLV